MRYPVSAEPKPGRYRILIVDDSRTMQAMLEQTFSARGALEVVGVATDAETAIRLVEATRPDAITIDLNMPDIDGAGLLVRLSGQPGVCKIIISGQMAGRPDTVSAMTSVLADLGADACFDKSEINRDPEQFRARVVRTIIKFKARRQVALAEGRAMPAATIGSHHPATAAAPPASAPPYPLADDEAERLRLIDQLGLANAAPERALDLIAAHLGSTAGFPICLVTFVGEDRQWLKSAVGMKPGPVSRDVAFCSHTICQDDIFAVEDARADARFQANPLVVHTPHVRAYFGHPIETAEGVRLGALCLLDTQPRKLTGAVARQLRGMAQIVSELTRSRLYC